jgi:hypothetical protein
MRRLYESVLPLNPKRVQGNTKQKPSNSKNREGPTTMWRGMAGAALAPESVHAKFNDGILNLIPPFFDSTKRAVELLCRSAMTWSDCYFTVEGKPRCCDRNVSRSRF